MFNPDLIEEVFQVTEFAFDANRLRNRLRGWLEEGGVEVSCSTEATSVRVRADRRLLLTTNSPTSRATLLAREVFNCAYAQVNQLLAGSQLPLIPLKMELAEMALIEVPAPLRNLGVTVMCGPFFSVMPFPTRGLHSLSHVRYTPHASWDEGAGHYRPALAILDETPKQSRFALMLQDAARYVPLLHDSRYRDSLWEIKALLPRTEQDDGRPILFKRDHGVPNLHCVLGGKIDNVYDLLDELDERQSAKGVAA